MRFSFAIALVLVGAAGAVRADSLFFQSMGYNDIGWITRSDNHSNEYVYSGQIDVSLNGGAVFPTYCISTNRDISFNETWNVNVISSVDSTWWGLNQSGFPQPGFNDFAYLIDNFASNVSGESSSWSGAGDPTGHSNFYSANDVAAALQLATWEFSDPSATYATSGEPSNQLFSAKVDELTDWFMSNAGSNASAENWLLDVYQPTNASSSGSAQTLIAPPSGGPGHPRFETPEPVTMSLGFASIGLFIRRRMKSRKA